MNATTSPAPARDLTVRPHLDVLDFMERQGGSFVKHLARAWLVADDSNRQLLWAGFREVYERYAVQFAAWKKGGAK